MKYIDADKLIAEIRNLRSKSCISESDEYYEYAKSEIIDIITFLQQEQPEKSKKNCDNCPHCVDRKDQYGWHFKGCFGGPYKGKLIAEIDECPLKQEQPEVDLEKEIIRYQREDMDRDTTVRDVARHFYNLGLNSKK